MRRSIVHAVATVMLCGTQAAIAQGNAAPATPATVPPRLTLPPGNYEIARLIGLFAQHLHRNILFAPAALSHAPPITLTEPLELDAAGCDAALRCFLVSRNLGLLPLDPGHGLYEVISSDGPRCPELWKAAVYRKPETILKDPNSKQMVITLVPLQHVECVRTANELRSFSGNARWPSILDICAAPNGSGIILRGPQDLVAGAIRFCSEYDRPPTEAEKQVQDHIAALEREVAKLREQIAALQKELGGK